VAKEVEKKKVKVEKKKRTNILTTTWPKKKEDLTVATGCDPSGKRGGESEKKKKNFSKEARRPRGAGDASGGWATEILQKILAKGKDQFEGCRLLGGGGLKKAMTSSSLRSGIGAEGKKK